ncbi:gliding motility-associated C-terminal domain-containing protein [Mucilaginibacter sp. R-33]|uniref:T9SS type B sorting domain-containing protein n=1 Tax=Mucilaginibacter sp. R-33 TaxID=3416711 RepID=UPI003CE7C3C6
MGSFFKSVIAATVLWFTAFTAFSQEPPDLTYVTPNVYGVGTTIPELFPSNSRGPVPATIYGETKVIAGTGQLGNVNGDAATAQFKLPYGISIDASGNMYIAESGGGIRMITALRQVSSIGTDALPGPPFNVPKLNNPRGIVKDKSGNLFVANYSNHNILKIMPSGSITVFAGINQSGTADGPGNVANIINPNGIAIDRDDNLYVSDGNNAIRKISPSGYVYTLAGQPAAGTLDGIGPAAQFNRPAGLTVDKNGNVYVADQGGFVIRKITPNGRVTTIAGSGVFGTNDGNGTAASFQSPVGITIDASGNLYVTDSGTGTIRRILPNGDVKTIAGGGPVGAESGVGADVHFSSPSGIAIGPDGNLYVAEYGKNSIKRVIATGYIIDKPLPPGLVFDPKTGVITGTPTVTWPATDYKVTAFNAGGSASFVINISVNTVAAPAIVVGRVTGTMSTCFGAASTSYQKFTLSGTNLINNISVSAPAAGFEISLSPTGGYTNSFTVNQATLGTAGVEVYIRLSAEAVVGVWTGNLYIHSLGANDAVAVATGVVNESVTPAVSIAQQNLGCAGQPVTFVATPINQGGNPIYRWFVNDVDQGVNSTTFTTSSVTSTDAITFILTNTDNCATIADSRSNKLFPRYRQVVPAVHISQQALVCPGEPVTFVATPTDAGVNPIYQWYVNGNAQDENSLSFTPATINKSDIVTFSLTNTSDCTFKATEKSNSLTPQYKPQITPEVSINQQILSCPGEQVILVALSTNGGDHANYQWYVNGSPQGANSVNFISSEISSSDIITVTLTNTTDCTSTPSVTSASASPMYIPLTFPIVTVEQPDLACQGRSVTFVANTHGTEIANSVYRWEINNVDQHNNNKTFPAPTTITAADKVTVTLINTSDCGPLSAISTPVSPIYKPLVTPTVTVEQLNIGCSGQPVTFVANTNRSEGINPVYRWRVNGVDQNNNGKTFPAPATITAADKVTVTLVNTSDCTDNPAGVTSLPISPVYKSLVTPTVTVEQPNIVCSGQPVTFVANTNGSEGINPVYRWRVNGVDQNNNGKTFPAPATITAADKVTVTLLNTSDCTDDPAGVTSLPVSPVYKPLVTPTVTVEQLNIVCSGQPVTFVANTNRSEGINPVYRWRVNGIDQNNNEKTFPAPATITAADKVTVTLVNTSDCTDNPAGVTSLPVSPVYKPQITPIVTIASSSIYPACEGADQTFMAVSPNAGSTPTYQWQLNHVNVGENSDKFTSNTLKNGDVLTCTISSAAQCTMPGTSNELSIETKALPTVAFNGELTIKRGESIALSPVKSDDIIDYSWSPSVGLNNSVISSPTASPTVTTVYRLTVTTAGGCQASAAIKVNVLEQMVIPNAFTPNGDGINDTWSIAGLAAYPNCIVNVFNRYGAGIFRSVGYAKNWNGSFNGYVLPAGTYYYVVDLKDGKKPLSGYVTLLK